MTASIQKKMASGAAWMVAITLLERSLGLISMFLLARLLAPADFGIMAMSGSFIAMAQMLTAFGFDIALIQNQKAGEDQYHAAWTLNVLVGLAILLLMLVAAEPIAHFYREPAVFWVVCALAAGPLIGGCENIGVVAFRKDLDFRKEFYFQISRKIIGFIVTVPLAFLLRSYWALVAGMLAARLAGTLTSYMVHPFRPRLSLAGASRVFSFSKWLLLNNGIGFLKESLPDFIIGRWMGSAALGTYSMSHEISHLPSTEIGAPINRALLPGFAKLDEPEALRSAYRNAMQMLGLIAIPAAAGILAVAPYLVPVALGAHWSESVPFIEILAISGSILMFQASNCSLIIARGFPAIVVRSHVVFVIVLALLLLAATPALGALGAAYATLATTALTMPLYLYNVRRCIGIPMLAFVQAVWRPAIASTAMVLVVRTLVPSYSPSLGFLDAILLLFGGILLGALSYVLAALALWLAVGRPAGAEQIVLRTVKGRLAHLVSRSWWGGSEVNSLEKQSMGQSAEPLGLHAGEWVVVKGKEEILATLDENACLEGLPFQPEMLAYCGKRLKVYKVAHKTCDTVNKTGGRRMTGAVHLEGTRCDGSAHANCQADCLFFWKQAWLRREGEASSSGSPKSSPKAGLSCTEEQVIRRARAVGHEAHDDPTWVCQTTALFDATEPLAWWDVRQYVRDVTSGNHSLPHMGRILTFAAYQKLFRLRYGHRLLIAAFNRFQKMRGGKPYPKDHGSIPDGKATPAGVLDLKPGEWVEVKPQEEILATITENGFNRGMRYDLEMSKYCGERFRVQMRVERLINEQTGKMMQMKNPCIQLENVYCRAECTPRRLGCPRASNTYWREIWLKRVDGPTRT